jgi:hypothetical protein
MSKQKRKKEKEEKKKTNQLFFFWLPQSNILRKVQPSYPGEGPTCLSVLVWRGCTQILKLVMPRAD